MLYTTITIGGKDYKARLNAKACVDVEKKLGTNPLNVFMKIGNDGALPALNDMIIILHAALQAYQHSITINDVHNIYDEFVDEGGTLMDLVPMVMEIFKVSGFFKEEENGEEGEGTVADPN